MPQATASLHPLCCLHGQLTWKRGNCLPQAARIRSLGQMTPAILHGLQLCMLSHEHRNRQSNPPMSPRFPRSNQPNVQPSSPVGRPSRLGAPSLILRDQNKQNTYSNPHTLVSETIPSLDSSPIRIHPPIGEMCTSFNFHRFEYVF